MKSVFFSLVILTICVSGSISHPQQDKTAAGGLSIKQKLPLELICGRNKQTKVKDVADSVKKSILDTLKTAGVDTADKQKAALELLCAIYRKTDLKENGTKIVENMKKIYAEKENAAFLRLCGPSNGVDVANSKKKLTLETTSITGTAKDKKVTQLELVCEEIRKIDPSTETGLETRMRMWKRFFKNLLKRICTSLDPASKLLLSHICT